ncbi:bidirectional sugar transporter SWEET5, partial [Physcomitrium patens]
RKARENPPQCWVLWKKKSNSGTQNLVKITILNTDPSFDEDPASRPAPTAVGIAGNVFSFIMFFSPLPTFWTIIKRRETGQFSVVPYVATLLNCLMWLFYGTSSVAGLMLVLTINAAGVVIESIYIIIHVLFGDFESRKRTGCYFLGIMVLYTIVLCCVTQAVEVNDRVTVVGAICVVIGSIMYSAPMTVIAQVIRDKNVANMPLFLSASSLINSVVWTTYGILVEDVFVIIPNGMGVCVCAIQCLVYFYISLVAAKRGASSPPTV